MADARVFIHGAAALGPHALPAGEQRRLDADAAPVSLRDLAKAALGQPLRQASRFIELAALGAQRCVRHLPDKPPPATAVYLGTGLADVTKTEAVFRQVVQGNGLASPFDFINAANNMAAFYVARLARLESRNLTVMQNELSFECALQLATDDVRQGAVASALVGGVDEVTQPRSAHLQRLPLDDDQPMGEGSGWVYLDRDPAGACAELLAVAPLTGALAPLVAAVRAPDEPVCFLPGFRLRAHDVSELTTGIEDIGVGDYVQYCGCYPTAAAYGIAATVAAPPARATLWAHANRDETGRGMVVLWRTFALS